MSKGLKGAKPRDLYVDKQGRAYMITSVFDGPTAIVQCLTPDETTTPTRIGELSDPAFQDLKFAYRPPVVKPPKPPRQKAPK